MNDPAAQPIDIAEQRNWIIDYRKQTSLSWAELAKRTGIPQGTLSQFGSDRGYAGNEQRVAEQVFRFRQYLAAQATIEVEAPILPDFFDTLTSQQLQHALTLAQRGRMVVAAMGPGTGKTKTARHFAACYPNVFLSTMSPSTAGVNNMQIEVLESLGERDAAGTPQKLSRRIRERLSAVRNPLLVIDEVQHLSEKALEEIRSWNDSVGAGIALFGNESLLQRLEGGNRRIAYAQLYSRVGFKIVRSLPLAGDVDAMAAAWNIHDEAIIGFLRRICMTPGGLRNGTMALELASMIAAAEQSVLSLEALQDAWAQLSSRAVLS